MLAGRPCTLARCVDPRRARRPPGSGRRQCPVPGQRRAHGQRPASPAGDQGPARAVERGPRHGGGGHAAGWIDRRGGGRVPDRALLEPAGDGGHGRRLRPAPRVDRPGPELGRAGRGVPRAGDARCRDGFGDERARHRGTAGLRPLDHARLPRLVECRHAPGGGNGGDRGRAGRPAGRPPRRRRDRPGGCIGRGDAVPAARSRRGRGGSRRSAGIRGRRSGFRVGPCVGCACSVSSRHSR